jgi:hypothetical protein
VPPGPRPGPAPGPSPTTSPANRPATQTQQPATERPSGLDAFAGFLRQGFDFVQRGTDIAQRGAQVVQQFTGQPAAPATGPAAPAPDQPAPAPDQPAAAGVDAPSPATPPEPAPPVGVPAPSWTMTGVTAPGPAATPAPSPTASADAPSGVAPSGVPPSGVAPSGVAPSGVPPSGVAPSGVAPGGQLAPLLQALQQRQIPPLPAPVPVSAPAASAGSPAAPQFDALSLLRLILISPQFQQALQPTAAGTMPRTLHLPVPTRATSSPAHAPRMRPVSIPLGAVMNTIAALAGQSLTELHAGTAEDEPEVPGYLVDADGEFIVDPASAEDRAALVAHYFRINTQARQEAGLPRPGRRAFGADDELSGSDAWARDAGFGM